MNNIWMISIAIKKEINHYYEISKSIILKNKNEICDFFNRIIKDFIIYLSEEEKERLKEYIKEINKDLNSDCRNNS